MMGRISPAKLTFDTVVGSSVGTSVGGISVGVLTGACVAVGGSSVGCDAGAIVDEACFPQAVMISPIISVMMAVFAVFIVMDSPEKLQTFYGKTLGMGQGLEF